MQLRKNLNRYLRTALSCANNYMQEQNNQEEINAATRVSEQEIAYHEAGHAVTGYLFYSVNSITMEPTVTPENSTLGLTGIILPDNMYLGGAENEDNFDEYLKVIICLRSGRYYQYKVAGNDDAIGAQQDEHHLALYLYDECDQLYMSLAANSHKIAKAFCEDSTVTKMVSTLAEKLIEKRTMNGVEIAAILENIDFDASLLLKKLHDKYYPLFSGSIKPRNTEEEKPRDDNADK